MLDSTPSRFTLPSSLPTGGGLGQGSHVMPGSLGTPLPNSSFSHSTASRPPLTSIAHAMDKPVVSVGDAVGQRAVYSVGDSETDADVAAAGRAKLAAMRRSKAAKLAGNDRSIHVGGMGQTFKDSGVTGFKRRFSTTLRKHSTEYKNLSQDEKKRLHDIIADRARHKAVGTNFNLRDKRLLRHAALKDYREGKFSSREDLKDFFKIISNLQK